LPGIRSCSGRLPCIRWSGSAPTSGGGRIWAKRDDCNSGLAFGGNKIRKLEYLVADAIAQGCDTLVSIGGVQSNHTRQVAAAAARVGMRCVLIQESWVDWPDAVYDRVGNILLSRILGADVRLVRPGSGSGSRRAKRRGRSSDPTGIDTRRRDGDRRGPRRTQVGSAGWLGWARSMVTVSVGAR
jgi:1-aminocyclopropane-1-carboxylate deaminase